MGRPAYHFTEKQLQDAIGNTRSFMEAARYLHISYNTFKSWTKKYGLWIQGGKNPYAKGIPKDRSKSSKHKKIEDIIAGVYNGQTFNLTKLKDWLIREAILEEKCDMCGFKEKRITDERCPVILAFEDGDKKNYKLENIKLLCYNHYFLTVGNVVGRKKLYYTDPFTGQIIQNIDL